MIKVGIEDGLGSVMPCIITLQHGDNQSRHTRHTELPEARE